MKTWRHGFAGALLLIIVALLLAGGAYVYIQKNQTNQPLTGSSLPQASSTAMTGQQITTNGHIVAFEEAVNKSDFSDASGYFADNVYVVLEGSSFGGNVTAANARQQLERIKGLVFTFNSNDTVVKEYMTYIASQYPGRRLIRNSPKLYFDEYIIGVESDISQKNKASIGYKVSNGKITDLFVNVGRDRTTNTP